MSKDEYCVRACSLDFNSYLKNISNEFLQILEITNIDRSHPHEKSNKVTN